MHMLQQPHRLRYVTQVVFTLIGICYIIICPYNKVEESFNVQATHDLYYYGIKPALYYTQHINQNLNDQIPLLHWIMTTTMPDLTNITTTTTRTTASSSSLPYDQESFAALDSDNDDIGCDK
jgi:hypothetical protein